MLLVWGPSETHSCQGWVRRGEKLQIGRPVRRQWSTLKKHAHLTSKELLLRAVSMPGPEPVSSDTYPIVSKGENPGPTHTYFVKISVFSRK